MFSFRMWYGDKNSGEILGGLPVFPKIRFVHKPAPRDKSSGPPNSQEAALKGYGGIVWWQAPPLGLRSSSLLKKSNGEGMS